uniref:Micro-fibrillar-associated protein 1 C-terminal domain-containing protein n=1 Tax=Chromera velia CCMP2878 TaxID=1169474 RepID=A0A0G4GB91_9ALVE|eukprot:Cvel_21120.t1-p1 / transcript=Cvel_21120.t1 / gene=Cvel_21120 / organism=Chromera_velia_CCMP2878 / gene_product=Microfibrillar-associated protein 1, putative / transcript_product=Microfibrillar-associated protein 1, putative / location=Cvel_scaffold1954:26891-32864(+) / protein_length=498 / sequence_SO=supercontig / SO=protein_coding / is_pseudo=false
MTDPLANLFSNITTSDAPVLALPKKRQEPKKFRYWPGRAPQWAEGRGVEEEEEESDDAEEIQKADQKQIMADRRMQRLQAIKKDEEEAKFDGTKVHDVDGDSRPVVVERRHVVEGVVESGGGGRGRERVNQRLSVKREDREGGDGEMDVDEESDDEAIGVVRRGGRNGTAAAAAASSSSRAGPMDVDEDDDEDAVERKRQRLRQEALMKREEEEERLARMQEELLESEEESEESEESGDEWATEKRAKPLFVPRHRRETIKEREAAEAEEAERERQKKAEKHKRKRETQMQVAEKMRQEEEEAAAAGKHFGADDSDTEMPDDTDQNNAEEYEMWKLRELKRIKRDREEREARGKFTAEIERRRRMTDTERQKDDEILDRYAPKAEKRSGKFEFMQKYYHKGAFFQDKGQTGEESIYNRDFQLATAEDKSNKEALPKPMHVRRGQFGKAGQTKWTHLTDNDTTMMVTGVERDSSLLSKVQAKMAAVKGAGSLARPSRKK